MWAALEAGEPSSSTAECRFIVDFQDYTDFGDPEYKKWFGDHGMPSVWPDAYIDRGLDAPLPPPADPVPQLGFVSPAPRLRRVVRYKIFTYYFLHMLAVIYLSKS